MAETFPGLLGVTDIAASDIDADGVQDLILMSGKEQSVSFDRKLINAVDKGCYISVLVNVKTGLPNGGTCPDAGSDKVAFNIKEKSVIAVNFFNLTVLSSDKK